MNTDFDAVAAAVYEEMRQQLWPLNTEISVHPPWVGLTDKQQRVWERAVQQGLMRSGVIPLPPGTTIHNFVFHRPRQFRTPKEGKQ